MPPLALPDRFFIRMFTLLSAFLSRSRGAGAVANTTLTSPGSRFTPLEAVRRRFPCEAIRTRSSCDSPFFFAGGCLVQSCVFPPGLISQLCGCHSPLPSRHLRLPRVTLLTFSVGHWGCFWFVGGGGAGVFGGGGGVVLGGGGVGGVARCRGPSWSFGKSGKINTVSLGDKISCSRFPGLRVWRE